METKRFIVVSSVGTQTPPPRYGGLEWIAAIHAAELRRRGHEVTVVGSSDSPAEWYKERDVNFIGTVPSNMLPIPEEESYHLYSRRLDFGDFDIIQDHSHAQHTTLLQRDAAKAKRPFPPVVRTIHDDRPFGWAEPIQLIDGVPQAIPPPLDYPCFVAPTFESALRLSQSMWGHIVRTVWHGIPLETYPVYNAPRNGRLILLARIDYIKGIHIAIDIARLVGVGLDIVGPIHIQGPYAQGVLNQCDGEQIVHHGEVSPEKKLEWLQRASALIAPSIFSEPFNLTVVEANACGTPAIVFARGGLQETTAHQLTGEICQTLGEMVGAVRRMKSTIENPIEIEGKRWLGEGQWKDPSTCRAWVEEHFTLEHMVTQYESLYKDVLDGRLW